MWLLLSVTAVAHIIIEHTTSWRIFAPSSAPATGHAFNVLMPREAIVDYRWADIAGARHGH